MHNATKYGVLLAFLAVLAIPSDGWGQATGKLSFDARAGVAIPAGEMEKITDIGGIAGASLAWNFSPNWAIRADFDYIKLDDGTDEFGVVLSPPMDLMFFGGAIEVNFDAPKFQDLPFTTMVSVGAGMMSMKVDDTFDPGHPANAFDHSYLTLQGNLKLGYQLRPWINIFINGTAYFMIMDSNDSLVFVDPDAGVEPFDTGWVIPLTAGVRLTFFR